jgi:hypothetical protein
MTEVRKCIAGGCLCGSIRYEADSDPRVCGYCFCEDCRKASGSAFIPFMGFASSTLRFSGEPQQFVTRAARGSEAVRNFCARCGGLVFGGRVGIDDEHTIYAGSLDERSWFRPSIAIFARERPAWFAIPPGIVVYQTMPGLPD